MIGLFVLLPALFVTALGHANPSIYASCSGESWSIDVGVQPGPVGTDLVQLTVDDGHGHVDAYEASIPAHNMKRALSAGLAFNNKAKAGDQGTFKLTGSAGTWAYQNVSHGLNCTRN